MERVERAVDAIFAFVWRWFWRILLWGVVAAVALIALLYFLGWANGHQEGWRYVFFGGLGGAALWELGQIRKLLVRLVEQNNAAALRRQPLDY